MEVYLGDFPNPLPVGTEYLTMVFSPSTVSLTQRWKNKNLSADFLAGYFANFFPGENESTPHTTRAQMRSAISYVANELLENAMKFNHDATCSTSIQLHLHPDRLLFVLVNSVDPAGIEGLEANLRELLAGDPEVMYLDKLESNALDETGVSSGLGLLTMLHDYGARLGWHIATQSREQGPSRVILTTVVQLTI